MFESNTRTLQWMPKFSFIKRILIKGLIYPIVFSFICLFIGRYIVYEYEQNLSAVSAVSQNLLFSVLVLCTTISLLAQSNLPAELFSDGFLCKFTLVTGYKGTAAWSDSILS